MGMLEEGGIIGGVGMLENTEEGVGITGEEVGITDEEVGISK